jgi:CBS domain-containing protein
MSPDPVTIDRSKSVAVAIFLMRTKKIRSRIIDRSDENDAYGIVTYSDIVSRVVAQGLDPANISVDKIATRPLIVINGNLRVEFISQLFARTGISHAPVFAADKLVGVISKADLVQNLV